MENVQQRQLIESLNESLQELRGENENLLERLKESEERLKKWVAILKSMSFSNFSLFNKIRLPIYVLR